MYTRILLVCPLFGGLSSFGVSFIGGFTVPCTVMCGCCFVNSNDFCRSCEPEICEGGESPITKSLERTSRNLRKRGGK